MFPSSGCKVSIVIPDYTMGRCGSLRRAAVEAVRQQTAAAEAVVGQAISKT